MLSVALRCHGRLIPEIITSAALHWDQLGDLIWCGADGSHRDRRIDKLAGVCRATVSTNKRFVTTRRGRWNYDKEIHFYFVTGRILD
jgi:hypothetical protein